MALSGRLFRLPKRGTAGEESHFTRTAGGRKDRRDDNAPMELVNEMLANADGAVCTMTPMGFVLKLLPHNLERMDGG